MSEDGILSTARYDGEPDIRGDFTDEFAFVVYDSVIRGLGENIKYRQFDDGIIFYDHQLTLSCTIQRLGESNGNYSAEILFFLTHSLFDEPLCEYTAGIGSNAEEALINGSRQFTATVLVSVFSAFEKEGCESISSEYAGKPYSFRYSSMRPAYMIGAPNDDPQEMLDLILDELPEYLGSKNAYWVKLYAVCYDDQLSCEVRINGAVMHDLSEKLAEYAGRWPDKQSFHSEKQFVMLLNNSPDTETRYVSAQLAISCTMRALELFGNVVDDESDIAALEKLVKICKFAPGLAHEIRALVPDIYTCTLLRLHQGDDLDIFMGGDTLVRIKKTQHRTFGYLEQGVQRFIADNRPDREFSSNVMWMGWLFERVNEEVGKGAELENIRIGSIQLNVPPDYELK